MADEKDENDSHEDEGQVVFLFSTILFPSDDNHINRFEALVTAVCKTKFRLLNRSELITTFDTLICHSFQLIIALRFRDCRDFQYIFYYQ